MLNRLQKFLLTFDQGERSKHLLEENKRLCLLSDLLHIFRKIRDVQAEGSEEDCQLKFDREVLQIVTLMQIHLLEVMSEEEVTKVSDELTALFKADREAQEAHE